MDNQEKEIRNKARFLLLTTGPSKRINEMSEKELRMLSGKAHVNWVYSELLDDTNGEKYWKLVESVAKERLEQIETDTIKFESTQNKGDYFENHFNK